VIFGAEKLSSLVLATERTMLHKHCSCKAPYDQVNLHCLMHFTSDAHSNNHAAQVALQACCTDIAVVKHPMFKSFCIAYSTSTVMHT
jgi:hypothetical protein